MELPKPVLAAVPLLISLAVRYTRCSSTDFSNPTCLTRPLADCACFAQARNSASVQSRHEENTHDKRDSTTGCSPKAVHRK